MASIVVLAAALVAPSMRALKEKEAALRSDRTVAFAVDEEDVRAFEPAARRPEFWAALRRVPVSVAAVPTTLTPAEETLLRNLGFSLLWKVDSLTDAGFSPGRARPGDGVMIAEDTV
ncbi:MAG: hypothetical protein JO102_05495, partial [Elusimicrobia bacterium]|nr:hypothetical protein [Elusimicrobiota bacterium]